MPRPASTPATSWQQLAVTFTADSTGKVRVQPSRIDGSGAVYWDDFSVVNDAASGSSGAFALGVSPITGEVYHDYGVTLGLGDATALSHTTAGNIDAFGVGLINIGNGPLGNHSAFVRTGTLEASDSFLIGAMGAETINIDSYGPGFVNIGSGTVGTHNAFLRTGSIGVGSAAGDGLFFDSNVVASGTTSGIIDFGAAPGDRTAIVRGGYFDALNLFSVGGGAHNGSTGSFTMLSACNPQTVVVRNSAGTGTQSLTFCTGTATQTVNVYGGIIAP